MDMWTQIVDVIANGLQLLTSNLGIAEAISIALLTVLIRLLISPITIKASLKMAHNKSAIKRLQPELEQLKETYKNEPKVLMQKTMAVYQEQGISMFDRIALTNMLVQGGFGFAMFQAIKQVAFQSKFMWLNSLAKPDYLLAIIVGVLTYITMVFTPGMAEQTSAMFFLIPAIISFISLAFFPSALAVYWAASQVFTLFQNLFVNRYLLQEKSS